MVHSGTPGFVFVSHDTAFRLRRASDSSLPVSFERDGGRPFRRISHLLMTKTDIHIGKTGQIVINSPYISND
ncbi:hypothetical protein PSAB6_110007 [Paraburkholderia sabiae]|nr:hypothetical protein PSAB6_110007 [Paraburkholderia sabiae]